VVVVVEQVILMASRAAGCTSIEFLVTGKVQGSRDLLVAALLSVLTGSPQ
jgi:hypothetical protein